MLKYTATLILMIASFFLEMALLSGEHLFADSSQPLGSEKKGNEILTKQEAARLRSLIYDDGLWTHTTTPENGPPRREIVLKNIVIDLHKKKRFATLELLLDIVKGGSPRDALTAALIALALEDGPADVAHLADLPLDLIDKVKSENVPTLRERFITQLKVKLENAKKPPEPATNKNTTRKSQ